MSPNEICFRALKDPKIKVSVYINHRLIILTVVVLPFRTFVLYTSFRKLLSRVKQDLTMHPRQETRMQGIKESEGLNV